MRLFAALALPAAVVESFSRLLQELRAIEPKAKWLRAENLHVTLKFIGEMPPEILGEIRGALAGVRAEQVLALRFRGMGFFPNEKRPRVIWAGIGATAELPALAQRIESALEPLGIAREKRAFAPHLTLARLGSGRLSPALREAIAKNNAREFGALRAAEFHLIESKLKPAGAEYTTVETFRFAAEEARE